MSALPRSIWALGIVSLFMDVSSEMVHAVLPGFLIGVIGAGALTLGIIEGMADAVASITKLFSGAVSDRIGKRKPLIVAGYTLSGLTKPVLALAQGVGFVLGARFADRIGKGVREAPRNAMISDMLLPPDRPAAFGLRQTLDTWGAVLGPLVAMLLLLLGADARTIFVAATVPALCAVLVLIIAVREPQTPALIRPGSFRPWPLTRANARRLPGRFWRVMVLVALFSLARFSESFVLLRGIEGDFAAAWVPGVLVLLNLVYALTAYPFARWSLAIGTKPLLIGGLAVLVVADLVLAMASTWPLVLIGAALWGLHMGMTQGLLTAFAGDLAPDDLHGTAYGLFHLVAGLALLAGSLAAGALWKLYGPTPVFFMGGTIALIALILVPAVHAPRPDGGEDD